jgi:hypothetical protein
MSPRDDLHAMPAPEFAHFGVPHVAYIKGVIVNGEVVYEIRAADGTELGTARNRDAAVATLRHNGLEAMSVY